MDSGKVPEHISGRHRSFGMLTLICAAAVLPSASLETDLDFWVGSWKMDSTQPDAAGKLVKTLNAATNKITKTLNGKVIEENFSMPGFNGRSWSVFGTKAGVWRQTWVDDSGAYLNLVGGKKGDEFVLEQVVPAAGMRMRFTEIKKDSFVWLWESKQNDEWKLQWRLDYRRAD